MKKLYATIGLLFFVCLITDATNYTSNGGDWNTATTWTPNGIPANTDNVTILSGNVTLVANGKALNVTINSGATLSNNNPGNAANSLNIFGVFTNNGTYAGTGKTGLKGTGIIIVGAGANTNSGDVWFNGTSQTITGTVNKVNGGNFWLNVTTYPSCSVTNQGHVSTHNGSIKVDGTTGPAVWTNAAGSYVGFQLIGFTNQGNFTINTSAVNDTVDYENSNYNISTTNGNTYYTLIIGGAAKTASSNLTITNLNIKSAGTLNVNGKNLNIAGNWLNNGTITNNTGTVTFNGTSAQTISGTGSNPFNNLTLSNSAGLTLASTSTLTGTLGITAGNFNAGSSLLTLISNATATARIGTVPSGSSLLGNYIIQRYITGTKTDYQCLSTPIKNMTLSVWDNDPGFYMSGIGGVHGNAGSYHSVYTINEPTNAYVAVTTTSYVLSPALGLYLYFGNGSPGGPMASFAFASKGLPNFGNITKNITYTSGQGNGFNLIGNPYPSPILWTNFHSDNSSLITGSFQIYDEATGTWVSSNGTTVSNGSSKLAANPNVITMCQGFECTPSGGSTTVTFKETEKTATDIPIVAQQAPNPSDWIRMQLSNNVNSFSDGTVLQFTQNASANFNVNEDVLFRSSFESTAPELYTLSSDNQHLTVNQMPDLSDEMTIPLIAKGGLAATYTISFEGINNLQKYDCVTLEDLTNNKTISLGNTNSYSFQVSDTSKINQFLIHFKHSAGNCALSIANNPYLENNVNVTSSANGVFTNFNFAQPQTAVISVYNVLGQKVISDETVEVSQNNVRLNIVPSNNIYLVVIHTNNQVITKKIYY